MDSTQLLNLKHEWLNEWIQPPVAAQKEMQISPIKDQFAQTSYHLLKGSHNATKNEVEAAISHWDEAFSLDSSLANALFLKADRLDKNGPVEGAIEALNKQG